MNEAQIDSLVCDKIIDENLHVTSTFKERAADKVAEFGGSWTFIFSFTLFFTLWVAYNSFFAAFDSYPFILLNLILSCLSVFQAPFILMSQNRMAEIDRKRAENDYRINLKAEMEIKDLNAKIDLLIAKLNCA